MLGNFVVVCIAMLIPMAFMPKKGGAISLTIVSVYRGLFGVVFLITAALFMGADWNTENTIEGHVGGRGAFFLALINFFISIGPVAVGLIWGAFGLLNVWQAWRGWQMLKSGETEWST